MPATVGWLSEAFGFVERVQIADDHRTGSPTFRREGIIGDARNDRVPRRPGKVVHKVLVPGDTRAHG